MAVKCAHILAVVSVSGVAGGGGRPAPGVTILGWRNLIMCKWWKLFVSIYWLSIYIGSENPQRFRRKNLYFWTEKPLNFWRRPFFWFSIAFGPPKIHWIFCRKPFFFWSSLMSLTEGWHHEGCVTHTGWHHALPPRVSQSLATPLVSAKLGWCNNSLLKSCWNFKDHSMLAISK